MEIRKQLLNLRVKKHLAYFFVDTVYSTNNALIFHVQNFHW